MGCKPDCLFMWLTAVYENIRVMYLTDSPTHLLYSLCEFMKYEEQKKKFFFCYKTTKV